MLKQIVAVKGIGLFLDAGPSPEFSRVTLIFGENGRGKSTLSCVLRSCSSGQGDIVIARSTLDNAIAQNIKLNFFIGADDPVEFIAAAWSKPVPDLQVFDADFVSENVYAGAGISPDQRAGLLEFALGDQAVLLRKAVDEAAAKLGEANLSNRTQLTVLATRAGAVGVDVFRNLPNAPDADSEIVAIQKRIAMTSNRDSLMKKALPKAATLPSFDASALFGILAKSLPDIQSEAEAFVREHLSKCTRPGFEQWVSEGSAFKIGDECPYCGADIEHNNLIKSYQTHFNEAYKTLKSQASQLTANVAVKFGDSIVDNLSRSFETAQAHIDGWKDNVSVAAIAFDSASMKAGLQLLRTLIEPLAKAKSDKPLDVIGSPSDEATAQTLWGSALEFATAANARISDAVVAIESYKKTLATEDVSALQANIAAVNLRKIRHSPEVIQEFTQLELSTATKNARTVEKETARNALDTLMKKTLAEYQVEINSLLGDFGAQISIDDFSFDYRGNQGLPRSDYRLKVRGHDIKLTGNTNATFGNSLSEGDKRSLAFAFFIARLNHDPLIAQKIVVIDDPMCSLDRRRRAATVQILKSLAAKCKQLIVLAHDASFLQELDDKLSKPHMKKLIGALAYCKITHLVDNYSNIGSLNIEEECATQYERDLATVIGYANKNPGLDRSHVARSLRVLLETNLHRQFPSKIPRNAMLGNALTVIQSAVTPDPLVALAPWIQELRSINDYATKFHHSEDGTPPDLTHIDEGELTAYCGRVLKFVLRG